MLDEIYCLRPDIINAVGEFTIHWSLFEEFYQGNYSKPQKIKDLDVSMFDFSDKPERFRNSLRDHIERMELELTEESVRKVLFTTTGDNAWLPVVTEYVMGNSDDIHDCLLCVYRIRNNLLHGEKAIFSLRSQLDLIQSASDILSVMTNWDKHLEWQNR